MQNFRELAVWQKAHALTLLVYQASKSFPPEELYGLTGQIRRSCASISYNLAEGCGRGSDADFSRFVQIAFGSACEVECQLLLANDLKILARQDFESLLNLLIEVKRMLSSLRKKLRVPFSGCKLTANS